MNKEVLRREVRFAVHLPKTDYREDTHYIKEQVYYKDGTSESNTFLQNEWTRPIWVTKKAFQNHKDKKEFELRENTHEQRCTQSDLNRVLAGMLESPHLAKQPNALKNSPYVYGFDQTSTSLLKLKNLLQNDFVQAPYTVATFDTETDIDTREILLASVAFKDKVHICVLKKYLKGAEGHLERFKVALAKYLPEYVDKLTVNVTIHDDEVSMLKAVFRTANEWAPDFLAIWNINFDIPRVLERLKALEVNPTDVLCDQSVPRKYRLCRYKEGITKKVTSSGKLKPINPSLQWHKLFCTARFYVIDAMCVYRQIRIAKQEEPSYSLDSILNKVLNKRKLTFVEADRYKKEKWHRFMQATYPIEYMVYHLYDCLSMLELDAVTKDLSGSLPAGAGMTDFDRFNSNPKKIVDALFLFGLERGKVVGTVPQISKVEEDEDLEAVDDELLEGEEDEFESQDRYKGLGLKGWIQMLPQNLLMNEGLKCFEDFPDLITNVRGMTWDVDATAAYPTCTMVANVSKATCVNEVIRIDGVTVETFKEQNLSLCMGGANSLEYFHVMYNLPQLDDPDLDALIDAA
jgi:hypothetical protein